MRRTVKVAALLMLGANQAAVAHGGAAVRSVAQDAQAFGVRESVRAAAISPGGSKILLLRSGPGRTQFVDVVDVASGTSRVALRASANPETIHWCEFGSETRMVCKYGAEIPDGMELVPYSRLVAVDVDGGNLKMLGKQQGTEAYGNNQFDGSIIDWLPDTPGSVLMARNYLEEPTTGSNLVKASGLGVDRVDLQSVSIKRVEVPKPGIDGYITDGRGNVRLQMSREARAGQLTGRISFRYRAKGSSSWQPFSVYDGTGNVGDYPIAVDADSNSAFVLANNDGRDALYKVSLDGTKSRTLIGANGQVDIDNIVRLGPGQKVIGYSYADDRRRITYFDSDFSKLADSLGRALPGGQIVHFEGATADAGKLLVFATGDTKPGAYYLLDRKTRRLDTVAEVRPELEGRPLAQVKTISFPAADGTSIPAYLTVPVGSSGKNLPTIVLPHGGPAARDEWGFDWLSQFLVARGYAVIQPNYRGSSGYGKAWLGQNGFKEWRKALGDISSAARFAIKDGIADPGKLIILGWSYGGYAALQSAAIEPSLYKAAVAIAPVTDLSLLKREADGFSNSRLVGQFIGSGDHLVQGSPLKQAALIKVPVLLAHGDRDTNVSSLHSVRMSDALRKKGTSVEFLRYKELDHQLDDSKARVELLTSIANFLDRSVGRQ
jgi:dipeptidyl aminopeptidase/acylaminoacyl peptidase